MSWFEIGVWAVGLTITFIVFRLAKFLYDLAKEEDDWVQKRNS